MPSFGRTSQKRLLTCHKLIQSLFNDVIWHYDCAVIQGHRNQELQTQYFKNGKSKTEWPDSKHNSEPSYAIDIAPWINGRIPWPVTPNDWNNKTKRTEYMKDMFQFYHFAGFVLSRAENFNVKIRWGGDWDMDHDLRDNKFDDLVHFELIGEL